MNVVKEQNQRENVVQASKNNATASRSSPTPSTINQSTKQKA